VLFNGSLEHLQEEIQFWEVEQVREIKIGWRLLSDIQFPVD
jgi:hypothetical protein